MRRRPAKVGLFFLSPFCLLLKPIFLNLELLKNHNVNIHSKKRNEHSRSHYPRASHNLDNVTLSKLAFLVIICIKWQFFSYHKSLLKLVQHKDCVRSDRGNDTNSASSARNNQFDRQTDRPADLPKEGIEFACRHTLFFIRDQFITDMSLRFTKIIWLL